MLLNSTSLTMTLLTPHCRSCSLCDQDHS